MKIATLLTLASLTCVLAPAKFARAAIVFSDSFDNDGLGTNSGAGGGLINRTIFGHSWVDDGNLQFNTSGTHFQRRGLVYSDNAFQSTGGFELAVNYRVTQYNGASNIAFGLVSDDTNFSTYSGFNPFVVAGHYGFGATADNGNLTFTNGTTATTLDDDANLPLNAATDVVLSFVNNGSGGANWSWSANGASRGAGTIATFDFTKSFQFVAYGQDDQGNKRINSVSLTAVAVPEPSSLLVVGIASCCGLAWRRRRNSGVEKQAPEPNLA